MDRSRVVELLDHWVAAKAPQEGIDWLKEKREAVADGAAPRVFYTSFSGVPRHLGKTDLDLDPADAKAADDARTGWQPAAWSTDQAGRTLLVLSLPDDDLERYLTTLNRVFDHADVGESVALYQALPLLPHSEEHRARAAEGIRSNMTAVFDAVALDNPYPAEQFDDTAWNQLVLKAVFVESPLHRILGLDDRANPTLARMLVDYAHERWAAHRAVTPELWRPVGPFAEEAGAINDLVRVLDEGEDAEREAAALALSASASERAQEVLSEHAELRASVEDGTLTWTRLGQKQAEHTP